MEVTRCDNPACGKIEASPIALSDWLHIEPLATTVFIRIPCKLDFCSPACAIAVLEPLAAKDAEAERLRKQLADAYRAEHRA